MIHRKKASEKIEIQYYFQAHLQEQVFLVASSETMVFITYSTVNEILICLSDLLIPDSKLRMREGGSHENR